MKQLVGILFLVFVIHVLISLFFIVSPSLMKDNRFSRIYKTYILPGPFFRDDKITTSYNYYLSWKKAEQWSEPVNPSKEYFDKYYENYNPSNLYLSRYIRSIDQLFFFDGLSRGQTKQFFAIGPIVFDQYIPDDADSVRLIATKEYVVGFTIKVDTLINPNK